MFAKVLNRYKPEAGRTPKKVYIGRGKGGSILTWSNPFTMTMPSQRNSVCYQFLWHLIKNPRLLDRLHELMGCDLECYCAPRACHGDLLLELANNPDLLQKCKEIAADYGTTRETYEARTCNVAHIQFIDNLWNMVYPSAIKRARMEVEMQEIAETWATRAAMEDPGYTLEPEES